MYLLDVYSASESMIEGGTGKDVFECLSDRTKHCPYVYDREDLSNMLSREVRDGEKVNIVFLGAGETNILAGEFAENLKARAPRWGGFFEALGPVASPSTVLRRNEPLRTKTTLRVGGAAEMYLEPGSEKELLAVLKFCSENFIRVFPLGRGSNLIVPEDGVKGLVIRLTGPNWKRFERIDDKSIRVSAGLRIKESVA